MFLTRTIAVGLVLMAAGGVHGILRGLLMAPVVGSFRARKVGVFIGTRRGWARLVIAAFPHLLKVERNISGKRLECHNGGMPDVLEGHLNSPLFQASGNDIEVMI